MRTLFHLAIPVGRYDAKTGWPERAHADNLIGWLSWHDLAAGEIYRVDINPSNAVIYRFRQRDGRPYRRWFRRIAKRAPLVVLFR